MRPSQSDTGVPPKETTRSPARSPARAAGEGGRPPPQSLVIAAGTQGVTSSTVLVTVPGSRTPTVMAITISSRNANTKLATTPATMTTARRPAGCR